MIGIYDDTGDRLPMAHGGLTINDEIYPVGIVVRSTPVDAVTEPLPQDDGLEAYEPRRLHTLIRIEGIVKAESVAQLHDRIEALNAAFDPVGSVDGSDDVGFEAFTFSVPTLDTTNYPTGLIPMQYFARSMQLPVDRVSKFEGDGARFSIVLQAKDPRRYLQTEDTAVLALGTVAVDNTLASYASFPRFTCTMTGAGDSAWRIDFPSDGDGKTLQLDLSGLVAGDELEIDFARREVYVDGTLDMTLYSSGQWGKLFPRSNNVNLNNVTGMSAPTLTWRRAFT